jgi:hypothetical protein
VIIRHANESDYVSVIHVINDWWGGRQMADMLPKLFFQHFQTSSFIAEQDNEMIGFLVGFLSQTYPDEAYIHFVRGASGLSPDGSRPPLVRTVLFRGGPARPHDGPLHHVARQSNLHPFPHAYGLFDRAGRWRSGRHPLHVQLRRPGA